MPSELLAIPFGIAVGILLGLLGGGGSILAVPVLVYVLGQEVRAATTESLVIVGATAAIAAVAHHRAGHVRWRPALFFSAAAAIGAFAGTGLNRLVDPAAILASFALLLLVAAVGVLRRGPSPTGSRPGNLLPSGLLPVGFATGALTGFYGVGGGFLIVPALAVLLGLGFAEAIGTSLAVIALTSAAALVAHLTSGGIDWSLTATFTAAAVIGALAGARASDRVPARRLQFGFATLLIGVAAFLLAENASTLL